jgi:hypothetical protein
MVRPASRNVFTVFGVRAWWGAQDFRQSAKIQMLSAPINIVRVSLQYCRMPFWWWRGGDALNYFIQPMRSPELLRQTPPNLLTSAFSLESRKIDVLQ